MARILVVDDEEGIRRVLSQLLEYEDHEVRSAGSAAECLALYPEFRPDLTFLDVKMARMDGLEALTRIREIDPNALVVMISGHGTIDTAVDATRRGAYDFLEKPLDTDRILLLLRNALQQRGLLEENARLRGEVQSRFEIVGRSFAIRQVLERVERVAPTDARVLITGENGTGKELIARALHRLSPRAGETFVEVNCAAIPTELIESELFGHVKGSFTGAHEDRAGKFEMADGGTLFLDEIGELPLNLQVKLLRVLQEETIRRLGDTKDVRVDVRIITATHRDLAAETKAGRFREDLYYRINVLPITIPPLRARKEDVNLLIDHFITRNNARLGTQIRGLTPDARKLLLEYAWPGNVRELRNVLERALVLASGAERIDLEHLPEPLRARGAPRANREDAEILSLAQVEQRHIERALYLLNGNRTAAAEKLGISRSTLHTKIAQHGLENTGRT
ncbi:MAG: sigma-54 dependent transcriptional regulator [Gemmatimonadetes bacterium]|nr:sigma-54 dependent transcriptional regulator [Gemmatimonadota bacterium]